MNAARQSGFSLIETLVAATIMFSVLISAFVAFQGSINASARAEKRIHLLAKMPLVRGYVTNAIRSGARLTGEGTFEEVSYDWNATLLTQGVAHDLTAEPEGRSGFLERNFSLWRVAVRLEFGGVQREFLFTEMTWDK